jgi:pyrroloquinoline quinone (PQQ) biosynthesis protein C
MDTAIQTILDETKYEQNPFFIALRDGSFTKEDFVETQIQFFIAVIFFSRPMAAVAAKIPVAKQRVEVLRNVWEEHGEGTTNAQHGETFLVLLNRLAGITEEDVDKRVLWPEVRMFNTTLTGACVMDEYLVGVGVMGMIERMFADISAWIGQSLVERGWLTRETLIHYNLHAELDIKHAGDFFNVLRPAWDASPESRYYIEQGLRLGAHAFYCLYEGLYRARTRRWMRDLIVPHARS